MRRSTSSSTSKASQAPAPRAPSTPTPWASSTISRAPCSRHSAAISGSGARSPSIENTPSTTTSTPPPSHSARCEHRLELVQPVVAEGADAGARHRHGVEDRGVVARVADHGVCRLEQRADAAGVGQVAGGEDERLLGAHPVRQLALQLQVQRQRAVEEAGAGEAGAEALQRVARGLLHARVAGQPEVVVRAQHDALAAFHLHHRAGRALEHAEVGHEVVLARRAELLEPLVAAGLVE